MLERQFGEVVVYSGDLKIKGKIFTKGEYTRGRISDALNRDEKFVSITDARVFKGGEDIPLREEKLIMLNKAHIIYVKPADKSNEK